MAINHECQIKLRHEIKQVLLLLRKKEETKSKTKVTQTDSTTASIARNNDDADDDDGRTTTNINTDADSEFDTPSHVDYTGDVNNICESRRYDETESLDEGEDDDVVVAMEDLLNMPYLDMIINESLRLLTTVPMNLRHVSADFQLNVKQRDTCTGSMRNHDNSKTFKYRCCCHSCVHVVVPKNTIIALDTFNMQRNKMFWGKNALKFFPEHFTKQSLSRKGVDDEGEQNYENDTSISRHSYSFIPFSKGLRTCIGKFKSAKCVCVCVFMHNITQGVAIPY